MKVFMRDSKINFVDENNVFLGYDMEQDCCEKADWFISDKQERVPMERDCDDPDLDGYNFDINFFIEVTASELDAGSMVIFRITNGANEKFIHIYNSHNGYYSHGFYFYPNYFDLNDVAIKGGFI